MKLKIHVHSKQNIDWNTPPTKQYIKANEKKALNVNRTEKMEIYQLYHVRYKISYDSVRHTNYRFFAFSYIYLEAGVPKNNNLF